MHSCIWLYLTIKAPDFRLTLQVRNTNIKIMKWFLEEGTFTAIIYQINFFSWERDSRGKVMYQINFFSWERDSRGKVETKEQ